MKKLLFVTTRLFWPTDSGRKVSLYYYCKGLHEQYGYDVYIYSFLEGGQSESLLESTPEFIKEVKLAKSVGKITKLVNLATKSAFGYWPLQNSLFYSKKNLKAIKEYANEISPDAIIVDMVRLAPYKKAFDGLNAKQILDLDDLLSKRYSRQACRKNSGNIMGAYANGKKETVMKFGWLKKAVLKSESKRIFRFEKKYGELYDNVVFVSQKETDYYNGNISAKKNAVTVRLGVEYDYFAQNLGEQKEVGTLTFLGNLKYAPNVDSLDLMVKEILPKLNFDFKLYVIGAGAELIKDRFTDERIVFCGRVDDMRPVIKKSEVFLAPIAYGTGIKTKILEAMAMGVPVVTTELGVEGIDAVNGTHILVADDMAEFADYVNDLHVNKEKAAALAEKGQQFIHAYYSWDKIYPAFKELGL